MAEVARLGGGHEVRDDPRPLRRGAGRQVRLRRRRSRRSGRSPRRASPPPPRCQCRRAGWPGSPPATSRAASPKPSRAVPIAQPPNPASRRMAPRAAGAAGQAHLIDKGAVAHRDHPVRRCRDRLVVGHDNEREPGGVEALEEPEHFQGRRAVQVAVGSSASTIRGSLASDRAIATCCGGPPDSADGRRPARSESPTWSSSWRARRRARRAEVAEERGQLHVLLCGQLVHQVEGLETILTSWRRKWARPRSDSRSIPAFPAISHRRLAGRGRRCDAAGWTSRSRAAP